jgi:hypothetical protein
MTQPHVPNNVLDKGQKYLQVFLGIENLEQQETKDFVTWALKE